MGRLATYVMVMSGLMLLFYFTGLLEDTGSSALLDLLLSPEDYKESSLNTQIGLVLLGIGSMGAIIIGVVTRNIELSLMGPLAIWILSLFWDFTKIFTKVYSENPVVAILLLSPIMFLWFITVVDWWRKWD